MRSPFNYIVETDNRYNNKIDIDGVELIVNTEITERDATFVNRHGRITNNPIHDQFGTIPIGSEVIVHHNVFRRIVGINGKEQNSTNYLDEDKYLVHTDQIFAYKNNGKWEACDGYCFVAPLDNEDTWMNGSEEVLSGVMVYPDTMLKEQGVTCGHKVGFTPNSEYEFMIDDRKLYRILSNHININYGIKETTERVTESSGERLQAADQGS